MIRGKYDTHRVTVKGCVLHPEASLKIRNHSPTGFAWGYGGSGPAQLALGLLLILAGREFAEKHYQDMKWDIIAKLPQEDFEIPARTVEDWIKAREEPSQEYDDDMLTGGERE